MKGQCIGLLCSDSNSFSINKDEVFQGDKTMKKIFKMFSMTVLSCLIALCLFIPISANESAELEIQPTSFIELERKYIGSTYVTKKPIGYVAGQPEKGTVFGSVGMLCRAEGGPNVSVSFGASYNYMSVSTSLGYLGESTMACDGGLRPHVAWKLYLYKDFRIEEYRVKYL